MTPTAVTEIAAEYKIQDMAAKGGSAACRVSEISGFVQGLKLCGQMTPHLQEIVTRVTRQIARRHYSEQALAALKHDAEEKARIRRDNEAARAKR